MGLQNLGLIELGFCFLESLLQVDDTKFLFEAKNIQKMELLVMSALKWRMNPVTPISFLDHIVRRLGLTDHVHWDFFKKCETLILSLISGNLMVNLDLFDFCFIFC